MNDHHKNQILIDCSTRVIEGARAAGIEVRLLGGIAIYLKCKDYQKLIRDYREPFSDIDLVTTSEHIHKLEEIFLYWGFEQNQEIRILFGHQRRLFYTQQNISIDVYVDKLILCQEINVCDRLLLDYPTLSCTDLLLSKIQNVFPKKKDLFDMRILLKSVSHPSTTDEFDPDYISHLCNKWGWWKTFKLNLSRLRESDVDNVLDNSETEIRVIEQIENAVDSCKKTLRWEFRNFIGNRVPWYNVVDDS